MKEKVLAQFGCNEVAPLDMYTDIFKLGEGRIQYSGEPSGMFKTNPIAIASQNNRRRRFIMFEDEFEARLNELAKYDWAYMSCVTYWGKQNKNDRQSKMYAMVFDLDGVTDKSLARFLDGTHCGIYPLPTYLVLSGHGVHPYYVFEDPVSLYPETKSQLKRLKYALTDVIWNKDTSRIKRPQYQDINQAYRIPGTKTKIAGVKARAFRVSTHPTSVGYLNSFVDKKDKVNTSQVYSDSVLTIEEAKALYPEWYQRRVLNKEPAQGWKANRGLYEWWKKAMFESAEFGHRYFCLMALAIYAVKCGISEEELRSDALSFSNMLNAIHPEDSFTESDMESALECYDLRYITFPREDISKLTGIPIPERKRNHQSRWTHLQADTWEIGGEVVENPCKKNREEALNRARAEGKITGRPKGSGTKQKQVLDYFRAHPDATVAQAGKELDISLPTIRKWKPERVGEGEE